MIGAIQRGRSAGRWRFRDGRRRYPRRMGYVLGLAFLAALLYLNLSRLRRVDREYRSGGSDPDDPD